MCVCDYLFIHRKRERDLFKSAWKGHLRQLCNFKTEDYEAAINTADTIDVDDKRDGFSASYFCIVIADPAARLPIACNANPVRRLSALLYKQMHHAEISIKRIYLVISIA